jgi:rsbT co-antagonist protein RsbR
VALDVPRLERLTEVIAAAFSGDYSLRIEVEDVEDPLLEVEVGINYLLDELGLREEQNEAQKQALREHAEALVTALSTPIIRLWPGVLILPLIGDFDSDRAERTTAVLLDRVAAEGARYVILDLTGVEAISGDTAHALLRIIRSTKLLGVACLVTGIHPRAAQHFVEVGADTSSMRTFSQVSEALEVVLRDRHVR